MKKRILALLLSLCMLLTLLPAGALATESAGTVTGTDGVAVAEEGYAIKVDSQTVDFGTVMRTTVASKEIVLTNTGSVSLKVALPESEFFTLDWEYYGSETVLDPGASVTVTIAPQEGL